MKYGEIRFRGIASEISFLDWGRSRDWFVCESAVEKLFEVFTRSVIFSLYDREIKSKRGHWARIVKAKQENLVVWEVWIDRTFTVLPTAAFHQGGIEPEHGAWFWVTARKGR